MKRERRETGSWGGSAQADAILGCRIGRSRSLRDHRPRGSFDGKPLCRVSGPEVGLPSPISELDLGENREEREAGGSPGDPVF